MVDNSNLYQTVGVTEKYVPDKDGVIDFRERFQVSVAPTPSSRPPPPPLQHPLQQQINNCMHVCIQSKPRRC
jgi:hypothetical protein